MLHDEPMPAGILEELAESGLDVTYYLTAVVTGHDAYCVMGSPHWYAYPQLQSIAVKRGRYFVHWSALEYWRTQQLLAALDFYPFEEALQNISRGRCAVCGAFVDSMAWCVDDLMHESGFRRCDNCIGGYDGRAPCGLCAGEGRRPQWRSVIARAFGAAP